jgi:predicted site-specific integrase-resolvase
MSQNRALLYVRARQPEDEDLANMALVHLSKWALDQEYQVTKVVREIGLGTDPTRPKLEEIRQAVTEGEIDIIIVERRDRILLMGSEAFARWAKDHGVIVEEAGVCSDRAQQVYAAEVLEDVFYPLTDTLALVVDDREQAEQAAARAMGEIVSFLGF